MQSQPQQGNQMMYLQSQSEYPSLQHPAAALNPPHPRTLPFNPHLPAINVNANLDQQQIHQIHADQTQLLNQQHLQQQSLLHQPHQAHQAQLHQHQQSQNLIKDDVSAASTPNSDSDNQKSALSRHVTAVISHFTANKDGYQRLINEIDDLLIVLSASANILFASSSILTFTDFSPSEVVGRPLMGLIHPDDASLLMDNISLTASQGLDWIIYARLKHKLGSHTLLEIRGKPYLDSKAVKYILLSGRPYTSKSTASIDSILSLRLENLRLKRQLELILVDRGMDPAEHHLLRDGMQVDLREMVALANGEDSNAAKKKKTASDELFCRSCGTTSSPEWRKGPLGPKTYVPSPPPSYSKNSNLDYL